VHATISNLQQFLPVTQQAANPLEHLCRLERELAQAEQRTSKILSELTDRLDDLEDRVSPMSVRTGNGSRTIERDLVALADRVALLEKAKAD
jgi:hypothetical protein